MSSSCQTIHVSRTNGGVRIRTTPSCVLCERAAKLLRCYSFKLSLMLIGIWLQAWEDTFLNWENSTRYLDQYPKTKLEEGLMSETIHRSVTKRRTSNQSTEHELEVSLWALSWNITCSRRKLDLFSSKTCGLVGFYVLCCFVIGVDLMKWVSNVRTYVHPSVHKRFLRYSHICAERGR